MTIQPIKQNERYALYDRRHFSGEFGKRAGQRYVVWDRKYKDVLFFETIPKSLEYMWDTVQSSVPSIPTPIVIVPVDIEKPKSRECQIKGLTPRSLKCFGRVPWQFDERGFVLDGFFAGKTLAQTAYCRICKVKKMIGHCGKWPEADRCNRCET